MVNVQGYNISKKPPLSKPPHTHTIFEILMCFCLMSNYSVSSPRSLLLSEAATAKTLFIQMEGKKRTQRAPFSAKEVWGKVIAESEV